MPPLGLTHLLAGRIPMKTRAPAWLLFSCCLGLLVPLQVVGADEQPQGFVKITLGVEGEGFEKLPVVGPLLKLLVAQAQKHCAEQAQAQLPAPPQAPPARAAEVVGQAPAAVATAIDPAHSPTRPPTDGGPPLLSNLPDLRQVARDLGH